MARPTFTSTLLLLLLSFSACSTNSELYLRSELANQGPMALSGKNPYMATNLFVAKEMKHSEVFRGFVHYRGTPDAVEVRQSYLKPLRVYLFYLSESEAFMLEEGSQDWLIRGPDKIPQQLMASFFNMQTPGQQAPLAIENDGMDRISQGEGEPLPPAVEPPPVEVRSLRKVPPRSSSTKVTPPVLPKEPPVVREKVEVEEEAPKTAVKESSSGDLIHKVTFEGESLQVIAKWYTGDVNNTGRVARINGIEKPDLLQIDQTIRIPRYLLKSSKPLTQAEVNRFNQALGKN